jgi:metallo-beta-lactamase class B
MIKAVVNAGTLLVGNKNYPQIADDYMKTFKVPKSPSVDLFLGVYGNNSSV